jgi:hypothetical protein
MKKPIVTLLIALSAAALLWAQGSKEPFDARKSREELEIMKGILNTTLSFVAQSVQQPAGASKQARIQSPWRFSNITGFYLAGQGAVFVIPTSGLRAWNSADLSHIDLSHIEWSQDLREQIESAQRYAGTFAFPAPPPPPPGVAAAPAAVPATPAPAAAPAQVDREELRKRVEELQAKTKKNREQAEAARENFLQNLAQIKIHLIEALANYGDSMTTVKPDEYINLVLAIDNTMQYRSATTELVVGGRDRHDVVSAQKSWISDYKAGRLTLDAFKQKVLQYTE